MKVVCCYCGAVKKPGPEPDHEVSHGICKPCKAILDADPLIHPDTVRQLRTAGQPACQRGM
jgi:hypothetical protein